MSCVCQVRGRNTGASPASVGGTECLNVSGLASSRELMDDRTQMGLLYTMRCPL